jgi:hypothetical protein
LCAIAAWPTRDDWTLTRDLAMRSLVCAGAKVWVNESGDYRANFITSPRLGVPKWLTPGTSDIRERACAPLPDETWLDLKGCFVEGEEIRPSKKPYERARQIHESGWTMEAKPEDT